MTAQAQQEEAAPSNAPGSAQPSLVQNIVAALFDRPPTNDLRLGSSQRQQHGDDDDIDDGTESPSSSSLNSPSSAEHEAADGLVWLTGFLAEKNPLLMWDDAELKKCFIKRYCQLYSAVDEAELIDQLAAAGLLPPTAADSWDSIADIDGLIGDARCGGRMTLPGAAAARFRKPALEAFRPERSPEKPAVAAAGDGEAAGPGKEGAKERAGADPLPPTRVPSPGGVDYSQVRREDSSS